MTLCPFCGADIPEKGACLRPDCAFAASQVVVSKLTHQGIPCIYKGQPESERIRKQSMFRILPDVHKRFIAATRRQGLIASSLVEQFELDWLAENEHRV